MIFQHHYNYWCHVKEPLLQEEAKTTDTLCNGMVLNAYDAGNQLCWKTYNDNIFSKNQSKSEVGICANYCVHGRFLKMMYQIII